MNTLRLFLGVAVTALFLSSGMLMGATDASAAKLKSQVAMPKTYEGKHMPTGGWTDPKMLVRGKEVYTGKVNKKVKCAKCHGVKGKPKAKGARDFRKASNMETFSDTYWFFRISEGVPKTLMKGWKGKISDEDIWAVMAYENTFSHGEKPAEPDISKWETPKFK